eukprot:INCI7521.1.p1 GENE.INCI7521.1~~INCI7521.1.p1  ORF type:complete len:141 (-),score=23.99 INCI7521.1:113-535(-)
MSVRVPVDVDRADTLQQQQQQQQPWTLAIVGLGVFGRFLAEAFTLSGAVRVVATSRADYSQLAREGQSGAAAVGSGGNAAGGSAGNSIIDAFYPSAGDLLQREQPAAILFATSVLASIGAGPKQRLCPPPLAFLGLTCVV